MVEPQIKLYGAAVRTETGIVHCLLSMMDWLLASQLTLSSVNTLLSCLISTLYDYIAKPPSKGADH